MTTINPYFTFNGNCEDAFNFYKSVFGGEFKQITRFKDMPMPGHELPADWQNKIMHVSYPINKETIIMGSDNNPSMGTVVTGQNLSLAVDAKSTAEADKIFNGLAKGGKVTMPIGTAPWGAYFGMLVDKFGFIWMVNHDVVKA
jgi:PhnB protein